jgi:hypothetical protein
MIEKIAYWHNRISDTDFVWFPFLFLKLKPHQVLTLRHRVKMAFCFGPYFVVGIVLRDFVFSQPIAWEKIPQQFILGFGFFLIWFSMVTAPLWNRRAQQRLSVQNKNIN